MVIFYTKLFKKRKMKDTEQVPTGDTSFSLN